MQWSNIIWPWLIIIIYSTIIHAQQYIDSNNIDLNDEKAEMEKIAYANASQKDKSDERRFIFPTNTVVLKQIQGDINSLKSGMPYFTSNISMLERELVSLKQSFQHYVIDGGVSKNDFSSIKKNTYSLSTSVNEVQRALDRIERILHTLIFNVTTNITGLYENVRGNYDEYQELSTNLSDVSQRINDAHSIWPSMKHYMNASDAKLHSISAGQDRVRNILLQQGHQILSELGKISQKIDMTVYEVNTESSRMHNELVNFILTTSNQLADLRRMVEMQLIGIPGSSQNSLIGHPLKPISNNISVGSSSWYHSKTNGGHSKPPIKYKPLKYPILPKHYRNPFGFSNPSLGVGSLTGTGIIHGMPGGQNITGTFGGFGSFMFFPNIQIPTGFPAHNGVKPPPGNNGIHHKPNLPGFQGFPDIPGFPAFPAFPDPAAHHPPLYIPPHSQQQDHSHPIYPSYPSYPPIIPDSSLPGVSNGGIPGPPSYPGSSNGLPSNGGFPSSNGHHPSSPYPNGWDQTGHLPAAPYPTWSPPSNGIPSMWPSDVQSHHDMYPPPQYTESPHYPEPYPTHGYPEAPPTHQPYPPQQHEPILIPPGVSLGEGPYQGYCVCICACDCSCPVVPNNWVPVQHISQSYGHHKINYGRNKHNYGRPKKKSGSHRNRWPRPARPASNWNNICNCLCPCPCTMHWPDTHTTSSYFDPSQGDHHMPQHDMYPGMPQHEMPQHDMYPGMPQHEMPQHDMYPGMPHHEMPQHDMYPGMPQHDMYPGMPQHEMPQHMYPGMPQHEMPQHDMYPGMPQHEMPQHDMYPGMPQHEMPQHDMYPGMPQHDMYPGMPQHEMPQHDMPQHMYPGMPQHEMPQHDMYPGMPQHEMPQHDMPQHDMYPSMSQHEMPQHDMYPGMPHHEMPQHDMYPGVPQYDTYPDMSQHDVHPGMPQHNIHPGLPQHMYPGMQQHSSYPGMPQYGGMYPGMSQHNMYLSMPQNGKSNNMELDHPVNSSLMRELRAIKFDIGLMKDEVHTARAAIMGLINDRMDETKYFLSDMHHANLAYHSDNKNISEGIADSVKRSFQDAFYMLNSITNYAMATSTDVEQLTQHMKYQQQQSMPNYPNYQSAKTQKNYSEFWHDNQQPFVTTTIRVGNNQTKIESRLDFTTESQIIPTIKTKIKGTSRNDSDTYQCRDETPITENKSKLNVNRSDQYVTNNATNKCNKDDDSFEVVGLPEIDNLMNDEDRFTAMALDKGLRPFHNRYILRNHHVNRQRKLKSKRRRHRPYRKFRRYPYMNSMLTRLISNLPPPIPMYSPPIIPIMHNINSLLAHLGVPSTLGNTMSMSNSQYKLKPMMAYNMLQNLPNLPNLQNLPHMTHMTHLPNLPNLPNLPGLSNLPNIPNLPNLPKEILTAAQEGKPFSASYADGQGNQWNINVNRRFSPLHQDKNDDIEETTTENVDSMNESNSD